MGLRAGKCLVSWTVERPRDDGDRPAARTGCERLGGLRRFPSAGEEPEYGRAAARHRRVCRPGPPHGTDESLDLRMTGGHRSLEVVHHLGDRQAAPVEGASALATL